MREVYYLVKRNVLFYLRDKAYIFFSLLSMLIILGMMVLFLGKANVDSLYQVMQECGKGLTDPEHDRATALYLISLWTLAGMVVVNSVTVTFSIYSSMIRDEWTGRLRAFYVAPVSRFKLSLGYILSAWVIGTGMSVITFLLGDGYFRITGLGSLGIGTLVRAILCVALSGLVFAAIGYLLALFVHTSSAWSGILTVIGTLVGFLGGIYFRVGDMSAGVQRIVMGLPVIHSAALVRRLLMQDAMTQGFAAMPAEFQEVFETQMGIRLVAGNMQVNSGQQVLILVTYAMIAIAVACAINRKRKLKDL